MDSKIIQSNEKTDSIKIKETSMKTGLSLGINKRSMRPAKSMKRLSILPKKFISISKVQKIDHPQVKSSELV